jgi:proteasome alpha subunit
MKPLEVEILVAEVGSTPGSDQLFHILYDGSVVDEDRLTVLGGEAEAIAGRLQGSIVDGWDLPEALRAAAAALTGPDRTAGAGELEVAVLDRTNGRRAFRRLSESEVTDLLSPAVEASEVTEAAELGAETDGSSSQAPSEVPHDAPPGDDESTLD